MRKWTSDEVQNLYDTHLELNTSTVVDFYPWARKAEKAENLKPNKTLQIDFGEFSNSQLRREFVLIILYLILDKRQCWSSIKAYYIKTIPLLLEFFRHHQAIKSLLDMQGDLVVELCSMIDYPTHKIRIRSCLNVGRKVLIEQFNGLDSFERDVWELHRFNLPMYRTVNGFVTHLYFHTITNLHNKYLLKRFVEYRFQHTEVAVTTIVAQQRYIMRVIEALGEQDLEKIRQDWFEEYMKSVYKSNHKSTYNSFIQSVRTFFDCGIEMGLWTKQPLDYSVLKGFSFQRLRSRCISDFVLQQIFAKLDKLPRGLQLMFMVRYYTGMRSSEAVHMGIDCLHRTAAGAYIQYYQFKMRKDVRNPIPQTLYDALSDYRRQILQINPNEVYMFPHKPGHPYPYETIVKTMKKFIIKGDIREKDGTLYAYRGHDIRHTLAVHMIQDDVPLTTVQRVLHHKSPEMTLFYAQVDESTRKERYLEFCTKRGGGRGGMTEEEKAIDDELLWQHHVISQVLPNGYCSLPVELGECPHANKCLTCRSFYTTRDFLPVLEYQCARLTQLLKVQEMSQKAEPVARIKGVIARLDEIITELKTGGIYENTGA